MRNLELGVVAVCLIIMYPILEKEGQSERKKRRKPGVCRGKEAWEESGKGEEKVWSLNSVGVKNNERQKWKVTLPGKESATLISPLPFKDNTTNTKQ